MTRRWYEFNNLPLKPLQDSFYKLPNPASFLIPVIPLIRKIPVQSFASLSLTHLLLLTQFLSVSDSRKKSLRQLFPCHLNAFRAAAGDIERYVFKVVAGNNDRGSLVMVRAAEFSHPLVDERCDFLSGGFVDDIRVARSAVEHHA